MIREKNESARSALKIAIILTIVNIVLAFVQGGLFFPFSITTPNVLLAWGMSVSYWVGALIVVGIFATCYYLSKRKPIFILIALILISIDSIWILFSVIDFGFDATNIINIVFRVWLIVAVAAGMSNKTATLIPLDGKILITQDFNDLEIIIRQTENVVQLIINGDIYADIETEFKTDFTLDVQVDDNFFRLEYNNKTKEMRLLIDYELVSLRKI